MILEELKYQYTNYMTTSTRGDKIRLWLFMGMALTLAGTIWVAFPIQYQLAQGSEEVKGLKVDLEVENQYMSQPAEVDTFQSGQLIGTHDIQVDEGLYVYGLQFEKGDLNTGNFEVCVFLVGDGKEACGTGYNSEEKKPEAVYVSLLADFQAAPTEPVDSSSSSSSAASSENSNTNANSQSQTVIICAQEKCDVQK